MTVLQRILYNLWLLMVGHSPVAGREHQMSISSSSAAQFICARGGWSVTNLALQKILYMAQMVHLGRTGRRLVDADFQAWDYGPVDPALYQKVRMFGDRPIQDIFFAAPVLQGYSEHAILSEACDFLVSKKPSELVAMTHWEKGAWAKHYVPGARSIVIPDTDIAAEYHERIRQPQ